MTPQEQTNIQHLRLEIVNIARETLATRDLDTIIEGAEKIAAFIINGKKPAPKQEN